MKRTLWIVGALAPAVVVLVPVSNLLADPPHPSFVEAHPDASFAKVAPIFAAKCADCHTTEGRRPFYASLPVAGSLIQKDTELGLDFMDMNEAFAPGGPVNEAVLAKIEKTILQDSMPPGRYVALHWTGDLDDAEREEILGWISANRMQHYAPPGLPEEVQARVIQPLPQKVDADPAKVALGRKLYHDVRLSGDDSLSCASCHDLALGGTDRAPVSTGIGGQKGPINSPTVFNAVFNVTQFWDGRATDLADQAGGPVANPKEMGSSWDEAIGKLAQDETFAAEYTAIYGPELTGENLQDAIGAFESTLITPNAPFDRFLMGESDAIDAEARRGWQVFQDAGCATCHVGKAMGGQSFERMGLHGDYFAARGDPTDADLGRFGVTKDERDRHRFKVPTLRNIALTAPYFHDASAKTLDEAVRTMATYQTQDDLDDSDVAALVAFLGTLTGELNGEPLK